jgi:hypothetical protein
MRAEIFPPGSWIVMVSLALKAVMVAGDAGNLVGGCWLCWECSLVPIDSVQSSVV